LGTVNGKGSTVGSGRRLEMSRKTEQTRFHILRDAEKRLEEEGDCCPYARLLMFLDYADVIAESELGIPSDEIEEAHNRYYSILGGYLARTLVLSEEVKHPVRG
jgi:hypothetical protein